MFGIVAGRNITRKRLGPLARPEKAFVGPGFALKRIEFLIDEPTFQRRGQTANNGADRNPPQVQPRRSRVIDTGDDPLDIPTFLRRNAE